MSFNDFLGMVLKKTGIDQAIPSGRPTSDNDDDDEDDDENIVSVNSKAWNFEPDYSKYKDEGMGKIYELFVQSTYVIYIDMNENKPKVKRCKNANKDFIKFHLKDKLKENKKYCLYSITITTYSNMISPNGPKVKIDFVYNFKAFGFGNVIDEKEKKLRLKGSGSQLHERLSIFDYDNLIKDIIPYACGKEETLNYFVPNNSKKEVKYVSDGYLKLNGNVAFHANSFIGRTLWRFKYFTLNNGKSIRLYKVDKERDYMCVEANKIHGVKTLIKEKLIKHLYYIEDCSFSYDLKFDISGEIDAEKLETYENNNKYIGTSFFAISFKYVEKKYDKKYDDIKEIYIKEIKEK